MSYKVSDAAYIKMLLHTIKYHKNDCLGKYLLIVNTLSLGVLIGNKESKEVVISDAIPLFHDRIMSGPLEIAFDMIENSIAE